MDSKFTLAGVESVFIEIPAWTLFATKNIIVASVYRPPDTNINLFSEAVADILEQVSKEGKICYIHGDFNINLLHCETNSPTANFQNMLYSFFYSNLIDKPTRITKTSQTLLDNIFTNSLDHTIHSGIMYSDISDHLPIFQFTLTESVNNPSSNVQYRVFHQKNQLAFQNSISKLSWRSVYEDRDAESSYQN